MVATSFPLGQLPEPVAEDSTTFSRPLAMNAEISLTELGQPFFQMWIFEAMEA